MPHAASAVLLSVQAAFGSVTIGPYTFDDIAFVDAASGVNLNGDPADAVGSNLLTQVGLGGAGGSLLLTFTDNVAINDVGFDLVIFEMAAPEIFGVEINGHLDEIASAPLGFTNEEGRAVNGVEIDLSDFGVGDGDTISSVRLFSVTSSADIAVVAAFNSAVPAPGAAALLAMMLTTRRRRPNR